MFLTLTTSLMLSAVTFCTSCISLATLRHSAEIRGASSSVNQCRTWSYFFSCVSVTILELKKKRGRKNELSRRRLEKGEGGALDALGVVGHEELGDAVRREPVPRLGYYKSFVQLQPFGTLFGPRNRYREGKKH